MSDMRDVIIPKSDQLNADDLIAGAKAVTITGVDIRPGTEQPVSIYYAGDSSKPWKPCKSMCRVLVAMWGADAKAYVGRSLVLFRDPDVTWAGMKVGGIRISHMSDIHEPKTMALTVTKQSRKPFVVRPISTAPEEPQTPADVVERGAEIAAILRDHGGSEETLMAAWDQVSAEVLAMPGNAQRGLRRVYDAELSILRAPATEGEQ